MTKTDLHILMLEDEPLDAELNKAQLLLLEEYNCIVNLVGDKQSYLHALETTNPDIILSDYNLPQYNGLEALHDLRKRNMLIPFIFVTGTLNEETAAGTIKAGAWDYVVKDRLFRLPLAIRSVLKLKDERMIAYKAEEKINRLVTAIEQTSSQIIVTDESGKIEYANKKFSEITGFPFEDILGKEITNLFSPEEIDTENGSLAWNAFKKGEVIRGETQSKKKNGSSFWEFVTITPIKNTDNIITNYVVVKEDITQRKIMEQELLDALKKAEQSDKLKDAFLQNLSHEIRTPLNAIVGFSELLHSGTEKNIDIIKEYTSIIRSSSNQLLSIVSDILTIASIQTGQERIVFKTVDVDGLIDHLYEIFLPVANEKKLTLSLNKPFTDKTVFIQTDETKLNQILTNLLNNAFKFTHQGFVELKYRILDKTIDFYVTDTGIGISKESQTFIFERFRQAGKSIHIDYGGTGLGLSISSSFAQMLGGTLHVNSEPGKGSTFVFSLPFTTVEKSKASEEDAIVTLAEKKLTILVVEDEINNFMLIEAILKKHDVKILHAANGYEALKICEKNPHINLVLMDIKMPEMDGVQAFKEIRKINTHLPIIAQTAYALEKEKQEFLSIGFDDYIAKPLDRRKLLNLISIYTGSA
ncbi:MAG: response regulator [Bacteroidales bacterium]|nr:response regulator [Bacteroidales bacterium]